MKLLASTAFLAALVLAGCASKPTLQHSGFISDYSRLVEVDQYTARYVSPSAKDYSIVMIDPVEARIRPGKLSDADRAEALRYMRASCRRTFTDAGFTVVDEPGVGVARVQLALTDIAKSTWWQKIHPGGRVAGVGTGGAAMEAEVIDSVTGEQIAALVQTASGNQFDFTAFSTLADVKSAMDKWSALTAKRLREMKREEAAR